MSTSVTNAPLRSICSVLTAAALVLTMASPLLAQNTATLQGFIAFEDRPAEGWRAVFVDAQGKEYTSGPTDSNGEYSVAVPAGLVYQMVAGIDADGDRHAIQNPTSTPVRVPATITLSLVNFQRMDEGEEAPPPPPVADTKPSTPAPTKTATAKKTKTPMTKKKKGTIIGVVLGGAAAAALLSGGSDSNPSPTTPAN